ncbi:MAG TPA: hypothetical protein VEI49_09920 [Terriglobales bacterium]|nr:hypothetical protein [Terriglobales bacterium]
MTHRIIVVLLIITAANAAELPDRPSKVADRQFFLLLSVEAAAKSADFAETAAHLGKQIWVPCVPAYTCINHESAYTVLENDPWFGKRPSTGRMIWENFGLFGVESLIAYQIKKPHQWLPGDRLIRKFWWVPLVYQTQAHARFAYHNSRF